MGTKSPDLFEEVYADETLNDFSHTTKAYNQFMVNRALSQFPDTIHIAAELDRMHFLPDKMHYDFAKSIIRPKKRYGKWAKASNAEDFIELVSKEYGYSMAQARQAAELFTPDAKAKLIHKHDKGGK